MEDLQDDVAALAPAAMAENEDFLDAVVTASRAAERTHQEEKITALRNACLNTVTPGAPDTDLRMMFFGFIDDLTTAHLRLLRFLDEPAAWLDARAIPRPNIGMGSRGQLVERALPELAGRRDFYDLLVRDLNARGLITVESLHATMTGAGIFASATSEMGRRFLRFIDDPRSG